MADVSKGYCFIPYNYNIDLEKIYFIKNYLKIPVCSIQESTIGKGVFYLIHDGTLPKPPLLDEEKNNSIFLMDIANLTKIMTIMIFGLKRIFYYPYIINFLNHYNYQKFLLPQNYPKILVI